MENNASYDLDSELELWKKQSFSRTVPVDSSMKTALETTHFAASAPIPVIVLSTSYFAFCLVFDVIFSSVFQVQSQTPERERTVKEENAGAA